MKSILQEASSIAKAVEQGWIKAGKPVQFSIKILEEAQKNFIGMTTQPARIALYFEEKIELQPRPQHREPRQQPQRQRQQTNAPAQQQQPAQEPRKEHVKQVPREHKQSVQQPTASQQAQRRELPPKNLSEEPTQQKQQNRPEQRQEALWNDEIIAYSRQWFQDYLRDFNRSDVSFTIEPNNLYLRITLSGHLIDQHDKERQLLASLSLLLFEGLKRKFKSGLRRHKIVITHA